MWTSIIGDLIPPAIGVASSPIPIVAVVLVLGTPAARRDGPAFAAGWIAGLAAVSTVVVVVAGGARNPNSESAATVSWGMVVIGVLFLGAAVRQWWKRPREGRPMAVPKWMEHVDALTAPRSFVLGVTLSGANPKNVAFTLTAAASIAAAGLDTRDTVLAVATYVVLGSVTVGGAVLFYVLSPDRAARPLAALKRFMARYNAYILMVVFALLGAKLVVDGIGGVRH